MEGTCALCHNYSELLESHRIPKFVTRAIKKHSFTKRLRNASDPNKPVQDSDKDYLLCTTCEKKFGKKETLFNQKVLQPFRSKRIISFNYDEWLHYFITSVSWRTLYYDVMEADQLLERGFNEKSIPAIKQAEQNMREYLLGEKKFLENIDNHIVFIHEENVLNNSSYDYSTFCNGAFGYLYGQKSTGSLYVLHVLAGIMIVSIIKKSPVERWKNTFVKMEPGKIKSTQIVSSPVIGELEYQKEQIAKAMKNMSKSQQEELIKKIENDPEGFLKSSSAIKYKKQ
ncbi:hypothetical protein [Cytobacillus oceanisediminis]|uniref:hypothetical protein n=1 Tax=Cytobacillus oceanisediminis TaxID=665099 RepID=UPI00203B3CA3|nr:hypothetical protein [Cytobacillus oceanisediminis]MCM3402981.1 hypothetical protein [Cytobacillus oceanisediminis]